jgi:hypothetical protein
MLMSGTKFIIKNGITKGLRRLKIKNPKVREDALIKGGLQLINWTVNGSPNEKRIPPVLTGALRGSGSLFVGDKFITATPDKSGIGTPNMSHSNKPNVITVGFNTDYARRLHETKWNPGPVSEMSGDVGNKFLRRHLQNDKDLLFAFIAKVYRSHY